MTRAADEARGVVWTLMGVVWTLIGGLLLFLAIEFLWSWDWGLRREQLLREAAFIVTVTVVLYVFNEPEDGE